MEQTTPAATSPRTAQLSRRATALARRGRAGEAAKLQRAAARAAKHETRT